MCPWAVTGHLHWLNGISTDTGAQTGTWPGRLLTAPKLRWIQRMPTSLALSVVSLRPFSHSLLQRSENHFPMMQCHNVNFPVMGGNCLPNQAH